ncbi:MAG: phosphate acyltransferase [Bacteroidetes bacterium GWA2_31_9]|nr:MAG: phosphate acyltransferase [Bacteroidetes bacterium GWA2_31_9]
MKIGVDIMGGDFAPVTTSIGAVLAKNEIKDAAEIVLFGDKSLIEKHVKDAGGNINDFTIVHSTEVIGMGEHPAKAFQQKPNSSIALGFKLLSAGEIDGFASAGSTGAMLVGAMYTVKSIPGVIRPTIAAAYPRPSGKYMILADVGINVDCKPDVLYQYAMLASIYAQNVFGIVNPKIGLMNVGEEEEKGNLLSRTAHELMKDSKDFNFIGNIEGNDVFSEDKCDVIITDGFTGNVILKNIESVYTLLKKRNVQDDYIKKLNFEDYGGTPVLGVNSSVMIGHGISNEFAIKNMIHHTKSIVESRMVEKIKEAFK